LRCKEINQFFINFFSFGRVPINTGCLGACTYCKTVQARGKLGSYAPEALIERVKQAVNEGVKEIWLTSEDTGILFKEFFLLILVRGIWKRYKYQHFDTFTRVSKESA